jgi:hypothetical protein
MKIEKEKDKHANNKADHTATAQTTGDGERTGAPLCLATASSTHKKKKRKEDKKEEKMTNPTMPARNRAPCLWLPHRPHAAAAPARSPL